MKMISKLLMFSILAASFATSAVSRPFAKTDFEESLKKGGTVLLEFHASWCPTCKKQKANLKEMLSLNDYKHVTAFEANYDLESGLKKEMKVSKQSTLIIFKNGKEVGRAIGVTNKEDLKNLINLGL